MPLNLIVVRLYVCLSVCICNYSIYVVITVFNLQNVVMDACTLRNQSGYMQQVGGAIH